jgi:fatty acyl-CoA reductase
MGEMLLVHHKDNIPLIIIRPTMITSTNKDPFPGWIEGQRYIIFITHTKNYHSKMFSKKKI